MKRALVTGSNGFLGRHLCAALRKQGVVVTAIFHHLHKSDHKDFDNAVFSDLSDGAMWDAVLARHQIDTVFHLAAITEIAVGLTDPTGTFETNIKGTWNILEACRRQKIRRVVVSSSDKAYGRTAPPYHEDLPLSPDRPYETSKACVDLIARTYTSSYGMSIATTRCVNLYGPGCLSLSTLVPNTIRRILQGIRPMIRNGGKMRRDWLYIDDAIDAYLKLAASDYTGPMNFGSGQGVTVKYIVDTLLQLMGSDLIPVDEVDRHGEIVDQWTNAGLAREKLGWKPSHSLEEGLAKCIGWYTNYFSKA